ncbi:MAG TPA: tetratricopeptide repeat protein, partial [Bacteroidota bacterium]
QLGVSAGLLLWTRPEGVILFGAILADLLYRWFLQKQESGGRVTGDESHRLVKAAALLAVFGIGYAAFNLALSGSILPNTYAAKLKYYSSGGKDFSAEVFRYLTAGHLTVFSVFAGAGVIRTVVQFFRRRQADGLIPLLFASGLFFAYWIKLPYLYQNGRYMMPVLPFVLILGLLGLEWLLTSGSSALKLKLNGKTLDTLRAVVLSYAAIHFAFGTWQERTSYQDYCAYINDRQVKAAHWIRNNLPESAVVATHDVGALAYYSNRRIVDMVGLVSPEMIDRIGNLDKLRDFLIQNGVTHLALLRNWFEVVNVTPVFQTSELAPEILEIFAFDPKRVHFTAGQVAWLTSTGWLHLARGDIRQAGPMLERAVQLDPQSSRARHHFGWALLLAGQFDRAEEEFRAAVALHPEYWLAHFARAEVALRRSRADEALSRLKELIELNPQMAAAHQAMAQIYTQQGDTVKARIALEAFRRVSEQTSRSQTP